MGDKYLSATLSLAGFLFSLQKHGFADNAHSRSSPLSSIMSDLKQKQLNDMRGDITNINIALSAIHQLTQSCCSAGQKNEKVVQDNLDKKEEEIVVHRAVTPDTLRCNALLTAFSDEKRVLRNAIEDITKLNNTIHLHISEWGSIESVNETVNTIKEELEIISSACEYNEIKENEGSDINNNAFKAPSFVSQWKLMRAQDKELATWTIDHGLEALPYKIDVQIRPFRGPNSGWIFPGDSALQADDDKNDTYGGVVYFYDRKQIYLTVPLKSNDEKSGTLICTGHENAKRLGDNHQSDSDAYVRVKAWSKNDLPEPDFESSWFSLNRYNNLTSFTEVNHNLNEYPALVTVQIKIMSGLVSDGVGASMKADDGYSNAGGIVWAFDKSSVRIWIPYIEVAAKPSFPYVYWLFGQYDGWGNANKFHNVDNVLVRVRAWSRKSFSPGVNFFESAEKNLHFPDSFDLSSDERIPSSDGLYRLYVEADEGPNKGFRFPSYGSSQSTRSNFGGVVYAYNALGQTRMWRPNPAKGGFLVHINKPYGNGKYVQATDFAHYVGTLFKPYKQPKNP